MANEMTGNAYVSIGGAQYGNFTSLTVKRDKKEMSASGTIVLSWPGAEMFNAQSPPAQELVDGAKGELYLDGQKAATVRVDSRTSHGTPTSFRLELSFRGLSSAIVDSHANHPSGQENRKSPGDICKKLMEGYEPQFKDESGESRQLERFILHEGETVERAMRRAGREFGLLLTENEDGDVVMKKKGADEGSGQPLVLGRNFTEWSVKRDIAPRYSKVKAKGNAIPTDERYGKEAEEIAGEATDNYVQYKRELHILVDSDHDKETLKQRAVSEANRRKGKGLDVTLTMSTWSDDGGTLWKVGKLHQVTIPVDQVDDELQISGVTFQLDKDKRETTVTLVSPETFSDDTRESKQDKGKSKSGAGRGRGGGVSDGVFAPSIDAVVS